MIVYLFLMNTVDAEAPLYEHLSSHEHDRVKRIKLNCVCKLDFAIWNYSDYNDKNVLINRTLINIR